MLQLWGGRVRRRHLKSLPRAIRRWLVTGPLIARLLLPAMSLPLGCAVLVAITGSADSSMWVIAAAVAITTSVRTIRNESPSRVVREKVFDATRTGVPSGDPNIDQVAGERLRMAAGQGRLTVLLSVVLLLVILAAPVAAALRTSVWWLVSYAGLPVLVPAIPIESWIDRPSARLDRLEQTLRDISKEDSCRPVRLLLRAGRDDRDVRHPCG